MAREISLRALLGHGPQRVGKPPRRALVIRREGNADVTVVENGVVGPICLLDLIERLGDQEGAHAVSGKKRERRLEELKPPQGRELIEHEEQTTGTGLGAADREEVFAE